MEENYNENQNPTTNLKNARRQVHMKLEYVLKCEAHKRIVCLDIFKNICSTRTLYHQGPWLFQLGKASCAK